MNLTRLLLPLFIFANFFFGAKAQKLTTRDVEEIQTKAKATILEYENLLNYVTFDDLTQKELENAIERSYMLSNNQIFLSKKVVVEDDIFPGFNKDNTQDLDIEKYLNKLNVEYTKTPDASIRFSNIQISNVKKKDFYYVKVYFESQFNSKYQKTNAPYPPKQRLAVITAEQNEGKWITRIASVTYYDPFKPIDSKENDVKVIIVEAGSSVTIRSLTRSAEPKHWNIGLKAGGGLMGVQGDAFPAADNDYPFSSFSSKAGATAGIFVRYHTYRNLGFTGEVLYTTKGAQTKVVQRLGGLDGQYNLNYLEIPLMLNYYFTKGDGFKPYLTAGASFAYLLSAREKYKFSVGGSPASNADLDASAKFNKTDFTLNAGIGFDTKITTIHRLTIEARYNYGMGNVYKESLKDKASIKTNAVTLSLGYSFGIAD